MQVEPSSSSSSDKVNRNLMAVEHDAMGSFDDVLINRSNLIHKFHVFEMNIDRSGGISTR